MLISQVIIKHLPSYLGFQGIFYYLNERKKYTIGMSQNGVSTTHAIGAISLSFIYYLIENRNIYNILANFSTGYFTFDFLCCLFNMKNSILKYAYLYHHIASIYICNILPKYGAPSILFWAELSNIPTYIVYYYIKNRNRNSVFFWKYIQLITYLIIRIPILGYLLYKKIIFLQDEKYKIYPVLPVYIMGLIWSIKLLK